MFSLRCLSLRALHTRLARNMFRQSHEKVISCQERASRQMELAALPANRARAPDLATKQLAMVGRAPFDVTVHTWYW